MQMTIGSNFQTIGGINDLPETPADFINWASNKTTSSLRGGEEISAVHSHKPLNVFFGRLQFRGQSNTSLTVTHGHIPTHFTRKAHQRECKNGD